MPDFETDKNCWIFQLSQHAIQTRQTSTNEYSSAELGKERYARDNRCVCQSWFVLGTVHKVKLGIIIVEKIFEN